MHTEGVTEQAVGLVVLGGVFSALLGGFVAFFLYSRTPAWRSSELRMATLRFLAIIGPFFGAQVEVPPPTPTAITTPRRDPEGDDCPPSPRDERRDT